MVLLKDHINTIANGDFWTVAAQTKDMVAVESMASFTNLANWTTLEAPLHIIKSRLADIQALDIERRRQIFGADATFQDMCMRISRCALSSVATRQHDRSMLQLHAISADAKNGDGLAQARQPYYNNNYHRAKEAKEEKAKGAREAKGGKYFLYKNRSWEECRDKQPHTIKDCPVRAVQICTRTACTRTAQHTRANRPISEGIVEGKRRKWTRKGEKGTGIGRTSSQW